MVDFNIGLSIDSFIACIAIGALPVTGWRAVRLAAAFGACDAVATLIGSSLPHLVPTLDDWEVYLICTALIGFAARHSRSILYLVPLLLSLDNLVAGASVAAIPALAVASSAMALAGLSLGGLWQRATVGGSLASPRWVKPDPLG